MWGGNRGNWWIHVEVHGTLSKDQWRSSASPPSFPIAVSVSALCIKLEGGGKRREVNAFLKISPADDYLRSGICIAIRRTESRVE